MIKSFKYKLNQTKKQEHKLLGFFGCARFIYNWGLDKKIKLYESSKKSVSYVDLAKQLTLLKKESEYQWLNTIPCACPQQSLRCLANAIQSAAWNEFKRQLLYKCDIFGKNVVFIGRFEPSSKMCHHCGSVNQGLTLSDREWTCLQCGRHLDRDVNAAINIRDIAFTRQVV